MSRRVPVPVHALGACNASKLRLDPHQRPFPPSAPAYPRIDNGTLGEGSYPPRYMLHVTAPLEKSFPTCGRFSFEGATTRKNIFQLEKLF